MCDEETAINEGKSQPDTPVDSVVEECEEVVTAIGKISVADPRIAVAAKLYQSNQKKLKVELSFLDEGGGCSVAFDGKAKLDATSGGNKVKVFDHAGKELGLPASFPAPQPASMVNVYILGVAGSESPDDVELRFSLEESGRMQVGAPASVSARLSVADLQLQSVDSKFAPGVENLDIKYTIRQLETQKVWLEIRSASFSGNVVFKRELSEDEKRTGSDKHIHWDGKGSEGSLNGKWAGPQYSPYEAHLTVEKTAPLEAQLTEKKSFEVKVDTIDLVISTSSNKVYLNDPAATVEVEARVTVEKKDGTGVLAPIEMDVAFTFTPNSGNVSSAASYEHASPKRLGKQGDTTRKYWKYHTHNDSSSADSYKTKCVAKTNGTTAGVAKIEFAPSGVGGNKYKIKAEVFATDGSTSLAAKESNEFTIWREIDFSNIYTMDSQSYINAGTVASNITPAFDPAFVKYTRGGITTLASTLTVKYIGLYKTGGGSKNWPTDFSPSNLESSPNQLDPTATELADYAGSDVTKKALAKAAIEAKAQLWFNAIVSDYSSCVSAWFAAASVPSTDNTLLAVEYYHPKLSGQSDGATNFWPSGISINLANPGSGLNTPGHPDQATWRQVQGFNRGRIVVVFKNYGTSARLQIICRHEIGHATKSEFKRDRFGTGDHSSSGLMTPWGSSNAFSTHDKKILRGKTP